VLFPYTPQKDDELELTDGDYIYVSAADQGQTGESFLLFVMQREPGCKASYLPLKIWCVGIVVFLCSPDNEGWFFGSSHNTGMSGLYPGNYVEKTKDSDCWTLHRSALSGPQCLGFSTSTCSCCGQGHELIEYTKLFGKVLFHTAFATESVFHS